MTNKKSIKTLNLLLLSRTAILNYLKRVIVAKTFGYRTFGTDIEEPLTDILVKIFTKKGFIKSKADYAVAPSKNYFPDFELKTKPPLALEFKSGNKSQYRKGKWVTVKNSENDLGTLNEWQQKIKKFGGENIYFIFVTYNFNDKIKEVLNIEIKPFYKFLSLNSGRVLKYREKDGNLRPKNFEEKSQINSINQFQQLFYKTVIYRSKRIIKKHKLIIKEASKNLKKV